MVSFGLVLVVILVLFLFIIFYKLGKSKSDLEWEKKLVRLRSSIADKQRAAVKGSVAETFAPYLGDFPFKPSECKFLGDPIDYVVFEGLDKREVTSITFVDVKTDSAVLSKHQRQIRDVVKKGKVSFVEYRVKT